MSIYGIHIDSDINNICNEINKYRELKCIQLFVDINKKDNIEYKKFVDIAKKNNIIVIVHASYTINLAQNWSSYSWSITQLIEEIKLAERINAYSIVVHLGKKLDLSIEEAINNMYSGLLFVHNETKDCKVKILLETSTGQGSEICFKLEDLFSFYNKFKQNKTLNDRFGICLDTCHIFNAGYDISNEHKANSFIKFVEESLEFKNIKLLHLNDSKNTVGSKLDRHENINHGFIGLDGLKQIIKMCSKLNIPMILETPERYIQNDINVIKKINL
jgi:deoxyribonuclease-4